VNWTRPNLAVFVVSSCLVVSSCGGNSAGTPHPPNNPISVSVSPTTAAVIITQTQQFTASVANTSNPSVTWLVNGTVGGDATVGTISANGLYTAPSRVPSPSQVTVTASSAADTTKSAGATITVTPYDGVSTYHNDNGRVGQNLNETVLTLANVNQATFGKLFSYPLDGEVFAQPLYLRHVEIPNQGFHNVVYVVTEHDSVYAFDAEGTTRSPLWFTSFINPAQGITPIPGVDVGPPISPEVGITSTPVIDTSTGTLYVVAATKENGGYFYRLHALDVATGAEKFGGPVVIQGSVPGTGAGSSSGQIAFQPRIQLQRGALLLSKGVVYITWASFNDAGPYHGWVMGYDAATLRQVAIWNDTANGQDGGIWQSGAGLSADAAGNIYGISGNGTFDGASGGVDFGDTFFKLTPSSTGLTLSDYFTPFNQPALTAANIDVGSSGFVLLPDQPGAVPHLGISAGKEGRIYLVNRDNLGHFQSSSDSQIVQSIVGALGNGSTANNFSTATYWQGSIYFIGNHDVIKQFQLTNGLLSISPTSQGTTPYGYPGANMTVSSNGASNGIVWAIEASGMNVLHVYDATHVSTELYNSDQAGTRDQFGVAIRFTVPTVINGKVYVAGQTQLAIFGLL
jgi:hypothetical protein